MKVALFDRANIGKFMDWISETELAGQPVDANFLVAYEEVSETEKKSTGLLAFCVRYGDVSITHYRAANREAGHALLTFLKESAAKLPEIESISLVTTEDEGVISDFEAYGFWCSLLENQGIFRSTLGAVRNIPPISKTRAEGIQTFPVTEVRQRKEWRSFCNEAAMGNVTGVPVDIFDKAANSIDGSFVCVKKEQVVGFLLFEEGGDSIYLSALYGKSGTGLEPVILLNKAVETLKSKYLPETKLSFATLGGNVAGLATKLLNDYSYEQMYQLFLILGEE